MLNIPKKYLQKRPIIRSLSKRRIMTYQLNRSSTRIEEKVNRSDTLKFNLAMYCILAGLAGTVFIIAAYLYQTDILRRMYHETLSQAYGLAYVRPSISHSPLIQQAKITASLGLIIDIVALLAYSIGTFITNHKIGHLRKV